LIGLVYVVAAARADEHPAVDLHKGWQSLFNGKDLTGWDTRGKGGEAGPSDAWAVENGTLTRKGHAYLRTVEQFGDFILDLEFKVGPGTNSGILLRHNPEYSAGVPQYWWNGLLEIQILDCYGKAVPDKHDCGALYDMVAPGKNTMKKPGEWNRVTITAVGSSLRVVMNGRKIIDVDLDDWTEAGKNPDGTPNKYHQPMKDLPRRGYILLQDHPGSIGFRNIYIKP
jgi:hypothetical protein